jgi:RHS repeat-associated protein
MSNPLRIWDERNHEFQYFYDILHRPTHSKVIGGDGGTVLNHIFERIFYGEDEPAPHLKNLRGQVVKHFDTGGVIETPEYDFKGQPKATTRKLYKDYKSVANWLDANLVSDLEADSFTFTTETDALGRISQQTAPDGSIITPVYNEAGLLNSETVKHSHLSGSSVYIKDIDYNEKGQRNKIIYGNNVISQFTYDKETFRLIRLETQRQNNDPLQDWRYTFDPVGNIIHIEDKNIPVVFFNNQKIEGVSQYTYDALYRLVAASGRENDKPLAFDAKDNWNDAAYMQQLNPGDPMAMRNYTQSYQYDAVGNILQMRHQASGNTWVRNYNYQGANNRLISTQIGANTYLYPHHAQHGYMTAMPHLEDLGWNFKEELVKTIRQRRTDGGTPETTYYQYDGQGQRIRKITENAADSGATPVRKDERIYVAGYELYKQHSGSDAGLERTSLSLMDQQHRFVMIDTETKPRLIFGIPIGRTRPVQTVRYQLHNHLGSAALELDDAARVISYEEYHPYGTTAFQAKNAGIKAAAKRYRYTGMERDEESGLEYHSARYYLPWLGRWISCDTGFPNQDSQHYSYSHNNPTLLKDVSGFDWIVSTGNKIYWFKGAYNGQKVDDDLLKKANKTFEASSGYATKYKDYRKAEKSTIKDRGPTPQGHYSIDLSLDPNRTAKSDSEDQLVKGEGIQKTGWDEDSEWGKRRAHLDPVAVTDNTQGRDNNSYYLHDSSKGYTHGCTEVQPNVIDDLINRRKELNSSISALESVIQVYKGILNEQKTKVANLETSIQAMEEAKLKVSKKGNVAAVNALKSVIEIYKGILNEQKAKVANLETSIKTWKEAKSRSESELKSFDVIVYYPSSSHRTDGGTCKRSVCYDTP